MFYLNNMNLSLEDFINTLEIRDVQIKDPTNFYDILKTLVIEQENNKNIDGIRYTIKLFIDYKPAKIFFKHLFSNADIITNIKSSVSYKIENVDNKIYFKLNNKNKEPNITFTENTLFNKVDIQATCYTFDPKILKIIRSYK
jgi:hypothetical protein